MFRESFSRRPGRRLLLGLVILAGVLFWWGRSRQHALDGRLIRAVRDGEMTAVEARLHEGANPNAVEDPQPVPLSFWQQVLRLIWNRQQRLNVLEIALAERRWLVAERLVKEGATVPSSGLTAALTRAASGGSDALVEHLLQKGSPVDAPDTAGRSPLWHAVAGGHPDIVEKLLDRGAKLSLLDSTPGTRVPAYPSVSALTRLHWHVDAPERRIAVLTVLLRKGMDIDVRLSAGRTMLMDALQIGDLPFAMFLIEHGANLDLSDANGNTARSLGKQMMRTRRGPIPPALIDRLEEGK